MELDKNSLIYNLKRLWKIIEGDLSPTTLKKVIDEFKPGLISGLALDTIYERQAKELGGEKEDREKQ